MLPAEPFHKVWWNRQAVCSRKHLTHSAGGQCCNLSTHCSNCRGGELCEVLIGVQGFFSFFFVEAVRAWCCIGGTDEGQHRVVRGDCNGSLRQISSIQRALQSRAKTSMLLVMSSFFLWQWLSWFAFYPYPHPPYCWIAKLNIAWKCCFISCLRAVCTELTQLDDWYDFVMRISDWKNKWENREPQWVIKECCLGC